MSDPKRELEREENGLRLIGYSVYRPGDGRLIVGCSGCGASSVFSVDSALVGDVERVLWHHKPPCEPNEVFVQNWIKRGKLLGVYS